MPELEKDLNWVTFVFDDDTRMSLYTTLNKDILSEIGIAPKRGYLFDFNSLKFVEIREDAISVEITQSKPTYEEGVLKFASKFIWP